MVQRLAAVAVSVYDHIQQLAECDWKRHWPMRGQILSERQLDLSLSLLPSPKNHHRKHSRSQRLHHPDLLRRCQRKTFRTSRWIHNGCRERKGARPSETPTSEISGRPVVKTRPASSPMIVPTADGSGTVVLSTPTSSRKDEMTIGGLYVIDGIDVVATLVPEEDV